MDYDANLVNSCPPAYVAQARAEDWTREGRPFVIEDAWTDKTMTQDCLNALLAYFTPKVGPESDSEHIDIWLDYLPAYQDPIEGDFRQDLVDAFLRLPYASVSPDSYYRALAVLKIDIREQLTKIVNVNWNFEDLDAPHADTWYYTMYLAMMDTPGAYGDLAKKVETIESGNEVYKYLVSLSKLQTDESLKIIKKYVNDRRVFHLRDAGPGELGKVVQTLVDGYSN